MRSIEEIQAAITELETDEQCGKYGIRIIVEGTPEACRFTIEHTYKDTESIQSLRQIFNPKFDQDAVETQIKPDVIHLQYQITGAQVEPLLNEDFFEALANIRRVPECYAALRAFSKKKEKSEVPQHKGAEKAGGPQNSEPKKEIIIQNSEPKKVEALDTLNEEFVALCNLVDALKPDVKLKSILRHKSGNVLFRGIGSLPGTPRGSSPDGSPRSATPRSVTLSPISSCFTYPEVGQSSTQPVATKQDSDHNVLKPAKK